MTAGMPSPVEIQQYEREKEEHRTVTEQKSRAALLDIIASLAMAVRQLANCLCLVLHFYLTHCLSFSGPVKVRPGSHQSWNSVRHPRRPILWDISMVWNIPIEIPKVAEQSTQEEAAVWRSVGHS